MTPPRGRLARVLGIGLLAVGGALVYASLQRRWGYYSGPPFPPVELSQLIPADRAALTLWWWDTSNNLCGPLPAIWPALALLASLPVAAAALRGRTAHRRWSTFSMVSALCGAATMLIAMGEFVHRPHWGSFIDNSGRYYAADGGTMALGLAGYVLLALGAWALRRAARAAPLPPAGRS